MRNPELDSLKIKRKKKKKSSDNDVEVTNEANRNEKNSVTGKKRRGRDLKSHVDYAEAVEIDEANTSSKLEKVKVKKRRKSALENGALVEANQFDDVSGKENGETKKPKKKKKKKTLSEEGDGMQGKTVEIEEEVYCISSGEEDCSKGMKKWLTDYQQSRPGLEKLQKRLDDFMKSHEEKLEQEKKEREAKAAEGGWTVVVHQRGRKKTTDPESGIAVGSAVPVAKPDDILRNKKKHKQAGVDFYRFQKREAHMNEILALQSKFEQDKKRIQQMRAARKFKPY